MGDQTKRMTWVVDPWSVTASDRAHCRRVGAPCRSAFQAATRQVLLLPTCLAAL